MITTEQTPDDQSKPVSFLLNGVAVTFEGTQTVRHLIEKASVSVRHHRIVEIRGGTQTVYTNLEQEVVLTEGSHLETIRITVYFVDDTAQVSVVDHLTVREILANAGVDPETHYLIELRGNEQIEHRDLNAKLHIREDERFVSIYHGSTPVS